MPTDVRADWSVLSDYPEVIGVIENVSSLFAREHELDYDDVYQEAVILVVTSPSLVAPLYDNDPGLTGYRLQQDLFDHFKTDLRRRTKQRSLEAVTANEDSAGLEKVEVGVDLDPIEGDYSADMIVTLLPAVWSDDMCYGLQDDTAPDPDMPRGYTNKARGNDLWAYIADIRNAYANAGLTVRHKQCLVLCYGMGMSVRDAGELLGIGKSTVNREINLAVSMLGAFLNG